MTETFSFVSRKEDKWASLLIKSGKYEGIIYQYGKVSVPEEENDDGNMPLSFKYNILDYNGHTKESLEESPDFANVLGDILVEILDEQLAEGNLEYADN